MPFFNDQPWLQNATRAWVWVLLTIPSTLLAVLFYFPFTRRSLAARKRKSRSDIEEEEVDTVDSANDS